MPSGPPAEFGESFLIVSIIIESERVIFVRNKFEKHQCIYVYNNDIILNN